jgi:hypothetical protein
VSLVIATIVFLLVVLAIASVRTLLVFEFTAVSTLIFNTNKPGLILYSFFSFPGTVLHELSHWLMAELLQVQTGEIKIIPDLDTSEKRKKLGSVMTEKTDPFRGFMIGIAPFIVGTLALFLLESALSASWANSLWWRVSLVIYGMVVIGNSMLISREDRRYWPIIGILLGLGAYLISLLNYDLSGLSFSWLINPLTRINLVLALVLVFNLILLVTLFGVRYVLEKLTRKQVITKRR